MSITKRLREYRNITLEGPTCSWKPKLKELKHAIRKETRRDYWKYVESVIKPAEDEQPRDTMKLWTFIKHSKG